MPTANWPVEPSLDAPVNVKYRVRRIQLGNGYEHVAPAGLNTRSQTLTLKFPALSATQKDSIVNFIDSLQGYQSFDYTLPGYSVGAKWRAESMTINTIGGYKYSVSVDIRQVFQ